MIQRNTTCTPHTCCNVAGVNGGDINTRLGRWKTRGELTSGVVGAGTLFSILTMCMASLAITDMDIIDVGVGLQCEDEAYQVCSR